jgi:Cu/Ag efflux pump CusA
MSDTKAEILMMLTMLVLVACLMAGLVCSQAIVSVSKNPLSVGLLVDGTIISIELLTRTVNKIADRRQPEIYIEPPRRRLPLPRILKLPKGDD